MSGTVHFSSILSLVLLCCILSASGDSNTRPQHRERRKQNPAEERKNHFGMTKDDFEWIQNSKKLIQDEIAARRGRDVNFTRFAPRSDSPKSNHRANSFGTGKSPRVWDDIVLSRPQVENVLHRLGLGSDSGSPTKKRVKRKIDNFETFPNEMWEMPIKYVIDPSYTVQGEAMIDKAVAQWMKQTCLVFEKHDPSEYITSQHLRIYQSWDGCWSYIGEQDPSFTFPQYISLSESLGCLEFLGLPMHELGHAIGLFHEQSRPDRDDTIIIDWNNIDPSYWLQFEEANLTEAQTYGFPYDVGSLMQYGSTDFAYFSGQQTITPKDISLLQALGQRTELSFYDIAIVNNNYCGGVCMNKLACQNGGYTDPKNCSVCRCPDGWGGTLCGDVDKGSSTCSPHSGVITVTNGTQCIQSPGYGTNTSFTPGTSCTWKLVAPANQSVAMWFNGTEFGLYDWLAGCQHWVEVRHSPGHVTRGQRFCGDTMPPYTSRSPIYSTQSTVTVLFKTSDLSGSYEGWNPVMPHDGFYDGFQLCFKTGGANPCLSNPCTNNGTCVRQGVEFMCLCDARHAGLRCELNQTQTIRLRDGNNQLQGRLEILYNNTWGTVCNYYFTLREAQVACRQLGYSGGSVLYNVLPGTGPVWLDFVACSGNENSLFDCSHDLFGNNVFGCSHYYDVGISCSLDVCASNPCMNGGKCVNSTTTYMCNCPTGWYGQNCERVDNRTLRLRDGVNPYEGRIEVSVNGVWGTVCDDGFNVIDAAVACRQLGYVGGKVLAAAQVLDGSGQIWLDSVACTGGESDLISCSHKPLGINDCTHREDVGLRCAQPCDSSVCQNNGVCLQYFGGRNPGQVCVCPVNYTNTYCQDFDNCASNPCQNGGVCRSIGGNYTCVCAAGFGGTNCQYVDNCASHPCLYGSCITTSSTTFTCACQPGYTGSNCSAQIDHCSSNPCQNGGTCYNYGVYYYCGCPFPYYSTNCEFSDPCISSPCYNGYCINVNNNSNTDFYCSCFSDYTGKYCNTPLSANVTIADRQQIRLVNGTTPYNGRVELLYNGVWGTMCDDAAGVADAVVACRQLGFSGGMPLYAINGDIPPGSGPIWLDNVICNGSELSLDACYHYPVGYHDCGHSEDFGVQCNMTSSVSTTTARPLTTTGRTAAPSTPARPTTARLTTARPTTARPTTTRPTTPRLTTARPTTPRATTTRN